MRQQEGTSEARRGPRPSVGTRAAIDLPSRRGRSAPSPTWAAIRALHHGRKPGAAFDQPGSRNGFGFVDLSHRTVKTITDRPMAPVYPRTYVRVRAEMSELRSALEVLQGEDLRAVPDEQLEADFTELQRAVQGLEAERLRRLAEIHRRQSHRRAGYLSTASWLVDRHRLGWTAAAKDIRTARSLQRMPHTREALGTGELTTSAVQMLVSARQAHPAQFQRSEAVLVEAAKRLPAPQLHHAVAHWRQQLDWSQGLKDADHLREQRYLKVSTTMLGVVRVDGDLDPETGEVVLTALRDCQDSERRKKDPDDHRTPAQRRVDALGEICRRWLNSSGRPTAAGERPHIAVIVDLRALEGRPGYRSELEHVGPIHPEIVRRLACDASISRVVTRGPSDPLDVGRRTSVVPATMRRAVIVRDGHCRFPGCDRPPPWCDAHHVKHWADGGVTSVSNLALLCRRHHRLVHEGGFRVEMEKGLVRFRRSDGTPLQDRALPVESTRSSPPSGAR